MEIEEVVKMSIFVLLLVLLVWVVFVLITGKGGDIFGAIKNMLRFGR